MRGLRWTCKSTCNRARELTAPGHAVSHTTVAEALPLQQSRLKGNRKRQEGTSPPDRNAQCLYSHAPASAVQHRGDPGIASETKKNELIGNYKNGGQEGAPKGAPREVKGPDFIAKRLGKALPYGVYDSAQNTGFVSVGIDHDTGACAVQTIRRWGNRVGREAYPKSQPLYLTADGGGSKASRRRRCTRELQQFAEETQLRSTVSHYPPGTRTWNKIEPRMFCHLTATWRAVPLASREIVVELIRPTTPAKGLSSQAELDTTTYAKGRVVTKQEFATLALTREAFHGEGNYTLAPQLKVT